MRWLHGSRVLRVPSLYARKLPHTTASEYASGLQEDDERAAVATMVRDSPLSILLLSIVYTNAARIEPACASQ
jgi:hypothetical protein